MWVSEELSESEARKEALAAEAYQRIYKDKVHWSDWMALADGLVSGRTRAMLIAGTNRPAGKGYARAFSDWMEPRPWARDLDKPTRAHLFWCADFRTQIEQWRDTLAQNERAKLNHPTAMKRRYEATHKVPVAKDGEAQDGAKLTKAAEIVRLGNENETLKREIDWLKAHPSTDGGLFDIAKTDPKDIARYTGENVGLVRTRKIRDALTQWLSDAEGKLRKKSKPAG
jgi:hypothetical protein